MTWLTSNNGAIDRDINDDKFVGMTSATEKVVMMKMM